MHPPSSPPPRRLARALLAVLALLGPGCTATPPMLPDGGGRPQPTAYASIGVCTPPEGGLPCPACGDRVVGPPDGAGADLTACASLDVAFTGGTIVDRGVSPAVLITLVRLDGAVRVQASDDGTQYVDIGYLAGSDLSGVLTADANCLARPSGLTAELSLSACHPLRQAHFLRFSLAGRLPSTIDAVQALAFAPAI